MGKKNKTKVNFGGHLIAIAFMTTIIFIILRLTAILDWHWVWVIAPLWGGMGLSLIISILKDIVIGIKDWNEIRKIK